MSRLISNYLGNTMLRLTLARPGRVYWLALHTDNPGVVTADAAGTELGGTHRQRTTFGTESGKAVVSDISQLFTEVPAARIKYLGLWDAPVGGNFLVPWELRPDLTTTELGHVIVPAGDLALQL